MSEIRLADDDKDRKYRIRVNEDGEEEIEILVQDEEEPQEEEYCEADTYGDEEEDTDEDKAERMRAAREEQERLAHEEAQGFILKAKERIESGDIQFALVVLDSAQKACEEEWEIYTLKLELLTNYFTDFSQAEECLELAEGYEKYVPEEVKAQFRAKYGANITAEQQKRQAAADRIRVENEAKKAERRVRFKERRARSLKNLLLAAVPFIIVLAVAIALSPYMQYNTGMLAAAIIMYVLALVGFVACVILLRAYARDAHRVSLNELDTSTALGREYLENQELAQSLDELYRVIMGTAESGRADETQTDEENTGREEPDAVDTDGEEHENTDTDDEE